MSFTNSTAGTPTEANPQGRAGDRPRPSISMTPALAAGIIVLVALALLVAIRFGFVGALGD